MRRTGDRGSGVLWARAMVILLLVSVVNLTVKFCFHVYYDREGAFQDALNCSLGVFRSSNVDCWLQNGTLLGSTRLGRLLLWDADLDIGFVGPGHADKLELLMRRLDLECFGIRSVRRLGGENPLQVFRKCTERICAEFHETLVDNGLVTSGDGVSPERELFPLKVCTVADVVAKCPFNSSYYLKEAYGISSVERLMTKKGVTWLGTPTEANDSELSSPLTSRIGGSAILFRESSSNDVFNCPKCNSLRWVSLLAQIYAPLAFVIDEDKGIAFEENCDWGDDTPKWQDDITGDTYIADSLCDTTEDGHDEPIAAHSTEMPCAVAPCGSKLPVEGFCYPGFALSIFEEPSKPKLRCDAAADQLLEAQRKYGNDAVEMTVMEGEDEPLVEKYIRKYVERMNTVPSQCIRWGPDQEPLRSSVAPIVVPKCPYCLKERRYELQVTSPAIYFLTRGINEKDHHLHFGNVLVYTCSANCNIQPYSLEYCVVEDEI